HKLILSGEKPVVSRKTRLDAFVFFSNTGVMELTPIAALVAMLVLASISFFFALAESALFSLGKWKAQQLADESGQAGVRVAQLLAEPQDLLATIVLLNTFANAGLIAIALWAVLRLKWPFVMTLASLLALILLGCEVVPKTLAVRAPELFALFCARPMSWLKQLTRPLRAVAQRLNSAILRAFIPKTMIPQGTL